MVTADHIIKDLHENITYEEFMKVLPLHGYKVGYDRVLKSPSNLMGHQVCAYHPDLRVCIIANTWCVLGATDTLEDLCMKTVSIYMPQVEFRHPDWDPNQDIVWKHIVWINSHMCLIDGLISEPNLLKCVNATMR